MCSRGSHSQSRRKEQRVFLGLLPGPGQQGSWQGPEQSFPKRPATPFPSVLSPQWGPERREGPLGMAAGCLVTADGAAAAASTCLPCAVLPHSLAHPTHGSHIPRTSRAWLTHPTHSHTLSHIRARLTHQPLVCVLHPGAAAAAYFCWHAWGRGCVYLALRPSYCVYCGHANRARCWGRRAGSVSPVQAWGWSFLLV